MNKDKLKAIEKLFDKYVEDKKTAGANVAVFKDGKRCFYHEAGFRNLEAGLPMTEDTIFACFSMTKPITATAIMILVERGLVDIFSPVSDYLPEFAVEKMKVVSEDGIVPAKQTMTIHNLLNMTSGAVYADSETTAGKMMAEVFDSIDKDHGNGVFPDTREVVRRIAGCPLAFEPGERWMYGTSADILGAVVEAASGMKLGEFLKKEIFEPLGMKDTGFYVPKKKADRLAVIYDCHDGKFTPDTQKHFAMEGYLNKPEFESGGAGLVSTIGDYGRFAMMLAGLGKLDGVRILSENSVKYMATNQLTDEQRKYTDWETMMGYGYGNLCRVLLEPAKSGCIADTGIFGWDGWTGNYVIADAKRDMAIIYVIQNCDGTDAVLRRKLLNIVYGS